MPEEVKPHPHGLELETCRVDLGSGQIEGSPIRLTTKELALLCFLAERPGTTVERDRLLTEVWRYHPGVRSRTLDVTMSTLRRKVEADPAKPDHLVTVHGEGYRFQPLEASSGLLGRSEEIRTLRLALAQGSIAWLHGAPGMGKTALARAAIRQWRAASWFVDLSSARTTSDVARALATSLGSQTHAVELPEVLQQLGRSLVVFDNAEQIEPAWLDQLVQWHLKAPNLALVVTSRHTAEVDGSRCIAVRPLPPDAAIDLLVLRAEQHAAGFATSVPASTLSALVAQLDRMPLAIELVASHAGVCPADQMLDLLASHPLSLKMGDRALQLAMEWSWSLLDDAERDLLAVCSIFRGGFDLAGLCAVCGAPPPVTARVLQRLVDHSLVVRSPDGRRFDLLQSIRAHAASQLEQDRRNELWKLHAAAFLARPEAQPAVWPSGSAFRFVFLERDNLLAIHERFRTRAPNTAAGAALALELVLRHVDPVRTLVPLLSLPGVGDGLHAHCVRAKVAALRMSAPSEPLIGELEAAMTLPGDDQACFAWLVHTRAELALVQGQTEEALEICTSFLDRAREPLVGGVRALWGMAASCHVYLGNNADGRRAVETALQLDRAVGDRAAELEHLGLLSAILARLGEETALEVAESARDLCDKSDDPRTHAGLCGVVCSLATALERWEVASTALEQVRAARDVFPPPDPLNALLACTEAQFLLARGSYPIAAEVCGEKLLTPGRHTRSRVLLLLRLATALGFEGDPRSRARLEEAGDLIRQTQTPDLERRLDRTALLLDVLQGRTDATERAHAALRTESVGLADRVARALLVRAMGVQQ